MENIAIRGAAGHLDCRVAPHGARKQVRIQALPRRDACRARFMRSTRFSPCTPARIRSTETVGRRSVRATRDGVEPALHGNMLCRWLLSRPRDCPSRYPTGGAVRVEAVQQSNP